MTGSARTVLAGGRAYAVTETGGGPPVVLLHSLGFDGRVWDAVRDSLSASYRCLAVDLPGHGSTPPSPEGTTLEEEAGGIAELLQAAGASPAHLVGLSLGALLALRVALAHPGHVRSLVLIAGSAEAEIPERRALYEELAGRAGELGAAGVEEEVLPFLFGREFLQKGGEALGRCREIFRSHDPQAAGPIARATARRSCVLDRLAEIRLPVLLIVGEADTITPPWRSKKMARALPDARLEVVEGAGHLVPAERPVEVTAILAGFLAAVEGDYPGARSV